MLDVRHRVVELDLANFTEEILGLVLFRQMLDDHLLADLLTKVDLLVSGF